MKTRNKKRAAKEREDSNTASLKRNKLNFNVERFIRDIFGNYRFHNYRATENLQAQMRRLATLIIKYAERNDIHDAAYLRRLILRIAMYNTNVKSDEIDGTFYIRLRDVYVDKTDWASKIEIVNNYLGSSDHDEVLNCISDEYFAGNYKVAIELLVSIARLIIRANEQDSDVIQKYFLDYLAVERFFMNSERVYPYLDVLEHMLQEYARQQKSDVVVQRSDGRVELPFRVPNLHARHKILSTVLYDWAKENGFTHKAKILDYIEPDTFKNLLSKHSLLKDNASLVGEQHGAWSHALQWFFIIEHHKHTGFLRHDPIDLYENFVPAWDYVIDLYFAKNFTSPEFITETLCEPAAMNRWPLLAGSVMRAHAKMYSPHFEYPEYLKEKEGEERYEERYHMSPL